VTAWTGRSGRPNRVKIEPHSVEDRTVDKTTAAADRIEQPDPREEALERVKARIAKDAKQAPADYLEETIVPEGGE
jgi:hypothetical protein